MKKIYGGYYLFDRVYCDLMPCRPEDIVSIAGALGDSLKEEVATRLVEFSKACDNKWCGVTWACFCRNLCTMHHNEDGYLVSTPNPELFAPMKLGIRVMVCDGLLVRKGWFSRVICPTPKLIQKILDHQKSANAAG